MLSLAAVTEPKGHLAALAAAVLLLLKRLEIPAAEDAAKTAVAKSREEAAARAAGAAIPAEAAAATLRTAVPRPVTAAAHPPATAA